MAANQQWADFMSLVDLDAAKTDQLGQQARMFKVAMQKYMQLRFDTEQCVYLADIVTNPAVVAAVVASLTHVAEDDAAVKAAVAAVIAP
jgi:hypothetical protein